MNRQELYKGIDYCGEINYSTLIKMLDHVDFKNPSDRELLKKAASVNGKLGYNDWLYFINAAPWLNGAKVNKQIANGWFEKQCKFTQVQMIEILESVAFIKGEPPTYLVDGALFLIDK